MDDTDCIVYRVVAYLEQEYPMFYIISEVVMCEEQQNIVL